MATNKNSLDRVLSDTQAELGRRIAELEGIGQKAKALLQEGERQERLRERREEVLLEGRDEFGNPIHPDIEEALDWLESEGLPNVEDYARGICEVVDDGVARLRTLQKELAGIVQTTTPGSFYEIEKTDNEDEGHRRPAGRTGHSRRR